MSELLSLRVVYKSFRRGHRLIPVLVNVSMDVDRRQIVAVIGSHAEGKTTLLELAAGLESADEGEVLFGGRELSAPGRRLLGHEIRWLDRRGPSLLMPVRDLVATPLMMGRRHTKRRARAMAMTALDRLGIGALAGESWDEVSNWERVLVVLAGGIVGSPQLLVVDDLLDGLGPRRTEEVRLLLRSLVEEIGFAVLMSVSDWDAALLADRIFNFEDHELVLMSDVVGGDVLPFERRRQGTDGSPSTNAC